MKVINKKDVEQEIVGPVFYIGRGSPLGNPWSHNPYSKAKFIVATREEAVENYRNWIPIQLENSEPDICNAFNEIHISFLKGEEPNLMCFCKPQLCHGDILIEIIKKRRWINNWFSNMKPFDIPMEYQGVSYTYPENFYQAMKLPKEDTSGRFRIARMFPHAAKKEIRQHTWREDWNETMAEDVMMYALRHKFKKGTSWRKKLDSTSGPIIEWNNWRDVEWGKDIFTGEGKNKLGNLLTSMRDHNGN